MKTTTYALMKLNIMLDALHLRSFTYKEVEKDDPDFRMAFNSLVNADCIKFNFVKENGETVFHSTSLTFEQVYKYMEENEIPTSNLLKYIANHSL